MTECLENPCSSLLVSKLTEIHSECNIHYQFVFFFISTTKTFPQSYVNGFFRTDVRDTVTMTLNSFLFTDQGVAVLFPVNKLG